MTGPRRSVFFVSDSTGITAETLGNSLLAQFPDVRYTPVVLPFVDTADKAQACAARIEATQAATGQRPLVFATLVDQGIRDTLRATGAFVVDFLERSLHPLEAELGLRSAHTVGRQHAAGNQAYQQRIEAMNFALASDDGLLGERELGQADIILIGVSRSGKTPTCLYLALQLGIKAANHPLVPEDFERDALPAPLLPHMAKLYGLSIDPHRLARIRTERRPGSSYASLENCRAEVDAAERLMRRHGVRWIDSTARSIEEIAVKILHDAHIARHTA